LRLEVLPGVRRSDLPLALLVAYVTALLAIPSSVGLHLGILVLTPSRVILAALIAMVVADESLREALRLVPKSVLIAWIAFLGSAAATTVLNFSSQAVTRYGSLVIEGLSLFLVVWCIARDRRWGRALHLSLVVATVIVAAVTLILAMVGHGYEDLFRILLVEPVRESTDLRFGLSRQAGSFPAPLFFATWLAAVSMLILPWLEEPRTLRRLAAWSAWAVLLLAAILTVSRAGIVVALGGAAVYFFTRRRLWVGSGLTALALVAALFMAGYTVALPSFGPGDSTGSTGQTAAQKEADAEAQAALSGSTSMRIEAVKAAATVLVEKPLFGWGLLSAGPVLSGQIGHPNYVDDTYIQYLVELGVVGFTAFMLMLLVMLVKAARLPWSPVHVARFLALLALMGMSGLASFLSITQGFAAFVVVMALAVTASGMVSGQLNET
jgi:O-antigen ligase